MSGDNDDIWRDVSFVQKSKNRKRVLRLLNDSTAPRTPTEISDDLQVAFNSASRAVRQLADNDLAVCINPESLTYRRYRLTDHGRTVLEKLEDTEQS